MKNKTAPLNFNNVCGIRTYLSIAIQGEIKDYKIVRKHWGVTSPFSKGRRDRIKDMITAYRAAKSIEIKW
jgi:hypothetical protein